jgi:regulator of protease activity HflC (stomatin/prohibitin superfamily)
VSILYRIDPDKANLIHLKYRDRFEEDFVRPTVRAITRDVVSGYNAEQLYGEKRSEIQKKIHDGIVAKFADSGLDMRDLLLRNITFSDEFIKAVESKQVAAQHVEQAKQDADKARTLAKGQADAAVTSAQGEADANVAKAKGDAQAIELRAAADAQALALINQQLKGNPQLIQWRYIEKLAGYIRMVLVPSNSPFLFNFNNVSNQAQPTPTPQRSDP